MYIFDSVRCSKVYKLNFPSRKRREMQILHMPYIKSKGPPSETRCRQEQILFVHLLRFTLYECIFLITELKKTYTF